MSRYYTLIAALPDLPALTARQELPLSRIALDKRLTLLSEEDREQLDRVESLYHPPLTRVDNQPDQQRVLDWQRQLKEIKSPALRQLVEQRLEWQTLLAALRSRDQSGSQPEHFYGSGRWTGFIRRHWQEPLFGLDATLPFLGELAKLHKKGASGDLEAALNTYLWKELLFVERSFHFTLETLVCYVLRFGLAEKHLQSNGEEALAAFHRMTEQLLASPTLSQPLDLAFEEALR
ncbi:hypothetical protein [Marinospirillum perlucidum]|uniref:hypothetical protein n=1 Tax=Marinospirillum perlucidum TaxID=1982602 RepID=UPI000DF370A8|nr:hypothetical protein [Marinospirillum perlucidum]